VWVGGRGKNLKTKIEDMSNLINALRQKDAYTANGALTNSTSLNAVVDMFFLAGASRRMSEQEIRNGLESFLGVKRRFEFQLRTDDLIYIDDYAHHPMEIKSLVESIRMLYPGKKVTGIFQPHLFSRTKDFADGFVEELNKLDELVLMPIYPAREEPIHGISSDWLLSKLSLKYKSLKSPSEVLQHFSNVNEGVVLTIGAGDIDRIVKPLKEILTSNSSN
jgi:UDP-N-acetylmuramate--alanine ligase